MNATASSSAETRSEKQFCNRLLHFSSLSCLILSSTLMAGRVQITKENLVNRLHFLSTWLVISQLAILTLKSNR